MSEILLQTSVVDITDWTMDEEFNQYPEGAKPKIACFSPDETTTSNIKPNWRYLLKGSVEWASEQFWGEIIAYHIGNKLGVNVPPAYIGVHNQFGYSGALIEWFYEDHYSTFNSAGQYFSNKYLGFDRVKGKNHNLVDSFEIGQKLMPNSRFAVDILMAILFDSVIGNTDRHQENWGFLANTKKLSIRKSKGIESRFYDEFSLAPFFDNGTSLGYELTAKRMTTWNSATLDNYIRRGLHHFREEYFSETRLSHLGSIDFLAEHKVHRENSLQAIKRITPEFLEELLSSLRSIEGIPSKNMLTEARADFIKRLTLRRVEMIQEKLI